MQKIESDDRTENQPQPALKRIRTDMENRSIFDDLFQDPETDSFPELDALKEFVYRGNRCAEGVSPLDHAGERDGNCAPRKKATYYLSEKVLVELFHAKAKIKILVPPSLKSKVSMSRIVDYAVHAILEEFKSVGKESDLFKQLLGGSGK